MNKYLLFFFLFFSTFNFTQQSIFAQASATKNSDLKEKWEEQEVYVNGFARVLQKNHFSFIDKNGNLIHPLFFDGARNFNNHIAAVKKNDKWGFINEAGKIIIPFKYTIAFDFLEAVTAVYENKKWVLINTKGEIVKPLNIDAFYGFKNGIAKISYSGKWGVVNTKGDITFNKTVANAPLLNAPSPKPNFFFYNRHMLPFVLIT